MCCVLDVRGELYLGIFQLGQQSMAIFGSGAFDGTCLKVHDQLYYWVRVAAGREPSPSEAAARVPVSGNSNDDFSRCGL